MAMEEAGPRSRRERGLGARGKEAGRRRGKSIWQREERRRHVEGSEDETTRRSKEKVRKIMREGRGDGPKSAELGSRTGIALFISAWTALR